MPVCRVPFGSMLTPAPKVAAFPAASTASFWRWRVTPAIFSAQPLQSLPRTTTVYRGIVTLDAFNKRDKRIFRPGQLVRPAARSDAEQSHWHRLDGWNEFLGHRQCDRKQRGGERNPLLQSNVGPTPFEIQNYIQAAAEARIIGGTLYVVVPGGGVYNFVGPPPAYPGQVIPLPYDPNGQPALPDGGANQPFP